LILWSVWSWELILPFCCFKFGKCGRDRPARTTGREIPKLYSIHKGTIVRVRLNVDSKGCSAELLTISVSKLSFRPLLSITSQMDDINRHLWDREYLDNCCHDSDVCELCCARRMRYRTTALLFALVTDPHTRREQHLYILLVVARCRWAAGWWEFLQWWAPASYNLVVSVVSTQSIPVMGQ
jgi:hypothetical protein